jgi:mono/diheme cytochrome c family protein
MKPDMTTMALLLAGGLVAAAFACSSPSSERSSQSAPPAMGASNATGAPTGHDGLRRTTVSADAFRQAYSVFVSPRCMNCHPRGDRPLQGDDSHVHAQNVQRGPDGLGLFAEKCAACHQETNVPGAHMPPGAHGWHLAPKATPLVFQGVDAHDLCRQILAPQQNGGQSIAQVLEHVERAPLVLWAWDPGEGRSRPPMSHAEFVRLLRVWIENGCDCPDGADELAPNGDSSSAPRAGRE